jgi:type IV secretion system protein TrbL
MSRPARTVPLLALVVVGALWAAPPPASASATGVVCSLTGLVSGVLGKICTVATHAGKVVSAGQKLAGGHVGGAIGALTGAGSSVKRAATTAVGLAAIATAVIVGARFALKATAKVIAATTSPNLRSTWFSAFYWRMAAVSALLTLPFLFAAAIQAMIRSDLGLLARAVFGYLPLGLLAVGIAAPLTMLLLAGSDEMSALVSSASGNAGAAFLGRAGGLAAVVSDASGDLFVMFFVGLLTAAATITLWVELLIRQAAVYVIVLMLPLFFAALVWPARRIWAARAVELLVALILSKFAIVSVLALGGAALGHTLLPGPASDLSGTTLVMLAAFTPWALLRLLPLHELAGAAAGGLSAGRHGVIPSLNRADGADGQAERIAEALQTRLPAPVPADTGAAAAMSDAGEPGPGAAVDPGATTGTRGPTGPSAGPAGPSAAPGGPGVGRGGSTGPSAGGGETSPGGAATPTPTGPDGSAASVTGSAASESPASEGGAMPGPLGAPSRTWRTMDLNADHDLLDDRPLVADAAPVDDALAADPPSPVDTEPPLIGHAPLGGNDEGPVPGPPADRGDVGDE